MDYENITRLPGTLVNTSDDQPETAERVFSTSSSRGQHGQGFKALMKSARLIETDPSGFWPAAGGTLASRLNVFRDSTAALNPGGSGGSSEELFLIRQTGLLFQSVAGLGGFAGAPDWVSQDEPDQARILVAPTKE